MKLSQLFLLLLLSCAVNALREAHKENFPEGSEILISPEVALVPSDSNFIEQTETREFLRAVKKGEKAVETRAKNDKKIVDKGLVAQTGSATAVHQSLLPSSSDAEAISLNAIALEAETLALLEQCKRKHRKPTRGRFPFVLRTNTRDDTEFCRMQVFTQLTNTKFGKKKCQFVKCNGNDDYRTFDGSCNNVGTPLLGKSKTPFIRLLPPAYQDSISKPRTRSVGGGSLPCAREISQALTSCNKPKDAAHTMMVMQWGQFIDHDLTLSPTGKLTGYGGGPAVDCCKTPFFSECFPICIQPNDPFFGQFGKTCMSFVRTMSAPSISCTNGPRQQMNALSHYHDGSMVYGSSLKEANNLREFKGGRLNIQKDKLNLDILPRRKATNCKPSPGQCFEAGDERVNEQPNLALTHTLWMREHNRIANHYSSEGYNDDEAFFLARRLVIAELQHITYNEFLPAILGSIYMSQKNLEPLPLGMHYQGYDSTTDPSISNAFATAAYRFGHSLLSEDIEMHDTNGQPPFLHLLSSLFSNQGFLHDAFSRQLFAFGLTRQKPEKVDMCFTEEVTTKLFEETNIPGSGLDLVALNIQRGRDHGLPSYAVYRHEFCKLSNINSFQDMAWLSPAEQALLASIYADVRDVDLFVGGLLEPLAPGAMMGETFQCIIGDQFYRLKEGDRYFYENKHQHPNPFTPGQLDAIKCQVSLARIFCDNADNIKKIQPQVFSSPGGFLQSCNNFNAIPTLDLSIFN